MCHCCGNTVVSETFTTCYESGYCIVASCHQRCRCAYRSRMLCADSERGERHTTILGFWIFAERRQTRMQNWALVIFDHHHLLRPATCSDDKTPNAHTNEYNTMPIKVPSSQLLVFCVFLGIGPTSWSL